MAMTRAGSNQITHNTGGTYPTTTTVEAELQALRTVAANLPGFRNRIINGAMLVNQRGISNLSSGVGVITQSLDRFYVKATGAAVSINRIAGVYASGLQLTGAAGNTLATIGQRIESGSTQDLLDKPVSISFWAYQTTGSSKAIVSSVYAPVALDTWSSQTLVGTPITTLIPHATWAYVTGTVMMNTLVQNGAALTIDFPGLAAGQTFTISAVQFEQSSIPTSFEYRPLGVEVELCQRYYAQTNQQYYPTSVGLGGIASVLIPLPVNMRTTPTVTNTFVDAQYTGPTAPSTGTQWAFAQPLLSYATKTGTVNVVSAAANNASVLLNFQSATFTAASLLFTTTNNYVYVNAEL